MRLSSSSSSLLLILLLILFFVCISEISSVDRSKFRQCSQSAFCTRNRHNIAENTKDKSIWSGRDMKSSIKIDKEKSLLTMQIRNEIHPKQKNLILDLFINYYGSNRVRIYEQEKENILFNRYNVNGVITESGLIPHNNIKWLVEEDNNVITVEYVNYNNNSVKILIQFNPLEITQYINSEPSIIFNARQLLNYEQYRQKNPKPVTIEQTSIEENIIDNQNTENNNKNNNNAVPDNLSTTQSEIPLAELEFEYDADGYWSESFGGHTDSKPRGPSSVSGDFRFLNSAALYGIPEHATSFALKSTHNQQSGDYNEPYRLYNLDVFEYELDNPMALYGAVPFLLSHSTNINIGSSALLWLNAAETFIDIEDNDKKNKDCHWISESGIIEFWLISGPSISSIYYQYGQLTGFPSLPPFFTLGYHQCRWNYKNEEDVSTVDNNFDNYDIPYDTLWLDIEHTDSKKYFTWDKHNFPTPVTMQQGLSNKGRHMVTIVDPHIKRDSSYSIHTEAESKSLYVLNSHKNIYEGSASYLDFFNPTVREFWSSKFSYNNYIGSTPNLYTWNDMNEPSVFNGPEVTMPKDCLHLGGTVEHRDVHNMYGFYNQMATSQGLINRNSPPNIRPFVLTRSFFAGSQRYGAVWTGDNKADWKHLEIAQPMLLSLNIAGITFSGADVGGFFGDPSSELLSRWYQVAAFHPFFRGHAHIDTKRREPWIPGEPYTSIIKQAIRTRYQFINYIYTVFQEASTSGLPVMRPLFFEFPTQETLFKEQNSFLLGANLLIHPIINPDTTTATFNLPHSARWFNVFTGLEIISSNLNNNLITIHCPLTEIPVLQRGGSIIPLKYRARRSSIAMINDPFTLNIALDSLYNANGYLYMDDGTSFDYLNKQSFSKRVFTFNNNILTVKGINTGDYTNPSTVERIIIMGLEQPKQYIHALLTQTSSTNSSPIILSLSVDSNNRLIIRKPDIAILKNFDIQLVKAA